jgi:hypothetical protein
VIVVSWIPWHLGEQASLISSCHRFPGFWSSRCANALVSHETLTPSDKKGIGDHSPLDDLTSWSIELLGLLLPLSSSVLVSKEYKSPCFP